MAIVHTASEPKWCERWYSSRRNETLPHANPIWGGDVRKWDVREFGRRLDERSRNLSDKWWTNPFQTFAKFRSSSTNKLNNTLLILVAVRVISSIPQPSLQLIRRRRGRTIVTHSKPLRNFERRYLERRSSSTNKRSGPDLLSLNPSPAAIQFIIGHSLFGGWLHCTGRGGPNCRDWRAMTESKIFFK